METRITETSKVCSRCHKPYPATNNYFTINKSTPGGLDRYCKACKPEMGREGRKRRNRQSKPDRQLKKPESRVNPVITSNSGPEVTPEILFKAVRRSIAEEICKAIMERFT